MLITKGFGLFQTDVCFYLASVLEPGHYVQGLTV